VGYWNWGAPQEGPQDAVAGTVRSEAVRELRITTTPGLEHLEIRPNAYNHAQHARLSERFGNILMMAGGAGRECNSERGAGAIWARREHACIMKRMAG